MKSRKVALIAFIITSMICVNAITTSADEKRKTGDVNGDGIVNAIDASLILRYSAYCGTGGTLDVDAWLEKTDTPQETTELVETKSRIIVSDDETVDVPFKAEVYSNDGRNFSISMYCTVSIKTNGEVVLGFYSDEDTYVITGGTSLESIYADIESQEGLISFSNPNWTYSGFSGYISQNVEDVNGENIKNLQNIYTEYDGLKQSIKIRLLGFESNYDTQGIYQKIEISKGFMFNCVVIKPKENIYVDTNNRHFIKTEEGKQYIDEDVSIMINGLKISRHIV